MPAEKGSQKGRKKKAKDPSLIKPISAKRGRKPLKDADADADLIHVPDDEVLFQKQYYSMGEVVEMFHINASLIRFWENQFDILQPKKNKKGDRFFRPEDIKNLYLIYHLLRQRKYTLEGAKSYLKDEHAGANKKFEMIQSLQKIRNFLLEIRASL
ncbi:MAG: MerR family transcriptional regulator [Williamsia sp.]|nr:MerR family transcriptional regulator [Williamsia sp.]